jgi:son of sevenless-like protein
VAQYSLKILDINTTLAVVSALNSVAVYRLKQTWKAVSKSALKQFQQLDEKTRIRELRALMEIRPLPCLPYLGMYLIDLSFVYDGYFKHLEVDWTPEPCVHWYFFNMISIILSELMWFKKQRYTFKKDEELYELLLSLPAFSSDTLYVYSKAAEPATNRSQS